MKGRKLLAGVIAEYNATADKIERAGRKLAAMTGDSHG